MNNINFDSILISINIQDQAFKYLWAKHFKLDAFKNENFGEILSQKYKWFFLTIFQF